jgi:SAM-dependent methyltransferase
MDQSPDHVRGCYDAVAAEYAEKFAGELAHKPLDRRLLRDFAATVRGPVLDFGCGPGQTTALLRAAGASVAGLDLSPALLVEARARNPEIPFAAGDLLRLPLGDGVLAGAVAFYAIVHFNDYQLRTAFQELRRVLRPGGHLLIAVHIGEETVLVDEFLGKPVKLSFRFFKPWEVLTALEAAGFTGVKIIEREPYPEVEYPSRRAYLTASAPAGDPLARSR